MYFINALYTLRYLSNPLYYLSFFINIVTSLITFSSAIEYEYLTNELVTLMDVSYSRLFFIRYDVINNLLKYITCH